MSDLLHLVSEIAGIIAAALAIPTAIVTLKRRPGGRDESADHRADD